MWCIPKYPKTVQKSSTSTANFETVRVPTGTYCFKLYHGIGDLLSMVSSEPLSFRLMCTGEILLNSDVSLRVFEHPSLRHPLVPVLGQHRGQKKEKKKEKSRKKKKKSDKMIEQECPATINKSFTAPAEPFFIFLLLTVNYFESLLK